MLGDRVTFRMTLERKVARILGVVLLALAVVGLAAGERQLWQFNTHVLLDVLHLALALFLLYVGYTARDREVVRGALVVASIPLILASCVGFISRTLYGLLSYELSNIDLFIHFVIGLLAIAVVARRTHKSNQKWTE